MVGSAEASRLHQGNAAGSRIARYKTAMTASMVFRASLTGAPVAELARALAKNARWQSAPDELSINDKSRKPTADWLDRFADGKQKVMAYWDNYRRYLHIDRDRVVKVSDQEFSGGVPAVLELLAPVPFTLAILQTRHLDWLAPPTLYSAPRLARDHFDLGWGCAFRGEGHANLVSRRWLEFGPWRLHRAGGDLSLVQFHDLRADSPTALAQASAAHERFQAGYLLEDHELTRELRGLYLPERREHRIVVAHRDVTEAEMLDACVARRFGRLPNPTERITFAFVEEERARAHLHELWIRGLGCVTDVDGREQALDEDYAPARVPPAWA